MASSTIVSQNDPASDATSCAPLHLRPKQGTEPVSSAMPISGAGTVARRGIPRPPKLAASRVRGFAHGIFQKQAPNQARLDATQLSGIGSSEMLARTICCFHMRQLIRQQPRMVPNVKLTKRLSVRSHNIHAAIIVREHDEPILQVHQIGRAIKTR